MRFLMTLCRNVLVLLFLPWIAWRRRRAAGPTGWIELRIDGAVVDIAPARRRWFRRSGPEAVSLHELGRTLELAGRDPAVRGLLVTLVHLRAGSATATSLRELLRDFRRQGKRVVVHLPDGGGTREVLVGSVGDALIAGPESFLAPLGFAVTLRYMAPLLERLGVQAEVFAQGRYKTAGETLVRPRMSDAQREQLEALLDVAAQELEQALATGRGVEPGRVQGWIDRAPWTAAAALREKIVDAVAYDDELDEWLDGAGRQASSGSRRSARVYRARRSWGLVPLRRPDCIGVVQVRGPITSRRMGLLPMAVDREVRQALQAAADDPRIKGVIVSIDSRGGSALASDRILHAVRKLAAKKPVVAQMGDAAASGGYMIAVGAGRIVAQPTTVTGSIGVVSARAVLGPLLERAGVAVEVVKRGNRADMFSGMRGLAEDERRDLEAQMAELYAAFVQVVAEGRRRQASDIAALAQGRVWSGAHALEHGLVDVLGGFDQALREVRLELGPGAERLAPRLITPRRVGPPSAPLPRWVAALAEQAPKSLLEPALLGLTASSEPVWRWSAVVEDLSG